MSSLGLNIGLKSLLTARAALDSIGHNLANANTPGYSRQTLLVSASPGLRLRGLVQGTGVQADLVQRTVDGLLHGRMVRQVASLGRLDARLQTLSQAESYLNTSSGTGVGALLEQFFAGVSTLSGSPDDPVLRSGAVQSAVELSSQVNQLATNVSSLGRETMQRLKAHVDQVNVLARQIGDLNRQITNMEAGSSSANDLSDRRDEALKSLAKLVDVKAVEDARGAVRVLVSGAMLVSPTTVSEMALVGDVGSGSLEVRVAGSPKATAVQGGAIGGLLQVLQQSLPKLEAELDRFAHELILEVNRVHSTGIGASGPFRSLVGAHAIQDSDRDGDRLDELLAKAGLPFDVAAGELVVNVTDLATGELTRHRIAIDPARTTVGSLVGALTAMDHLTAKLDGQGRLLVLADSGFGFDFSPRLDPAPDKIGSFGGGAPSLGTGAAGPFALSVGDTLQLTGPAGPFAITFQASDFQQIGAATAEEIAAVINADPQAQANGLAASAVAGHLVLQGSATGSSASFDVAGGSALAALGWSAGTTVSGHDTAVNARLSGVWTGTSNGSLTFRPNMDGTVGTTPGLKVGVYDATGAQVAELDVGPGYAPGDEIDVLNGVKARFDFGELSAAHGDVFQVDVIADSDTADVLAALGLNALFTGHDADTIGVRDDIQRDPRLLAGSLSGAPGDGSNLLALLELERSSVEGLGGASLGQGFAEVVGGVALEISTVSSAMEAEQFLLDSLEERRAQISGVNVDEELVRMIEQEQAFGAAAQYLRVISEITNDLMRIL